jgi:hypothetical protein
MILPFRSVINLLGFETGRCRGIPIIPIMSGDPLKAIETS